MRDTWFKSGKWNAVCDVCGFNFKNTDLKLRWDGLMVCKDDWETRHPQELIRPIPDRTQVPWTRPVGDDRDVPNLPPRPQACSVFGQFANAGYAEAGCAEAGNFLRTL